MTWNYPEDITLAMPINTLAMAILQDIKSQGETNRQNWILGAREHGTLKSAEATRALSEGWAWLEARGLVALDPAQMTSNARFITRLGREALSVGVERMDAANRLGMELHPILAERVERQYLMGEYELAVFTAFKAVEVRVRNLAGLPNATVGTRLMADAFNVKSGPLLDTDAEPAEQEAELSLFRGAMGLFKNPSSHRPVDHDDLTLAAEAILFADLLMRLLDRRTGDAAERAES